MHAGHTHAHAYTRTHTSARRAVNFVADLWRSGGGEERRAAAEALQIIKSNGFVLKLSEQ